MSPVDNGQMVDIPHMIYSTALILRNIYHENTVDGDTSLKGLSDMQDVLAAVPEELRGEVFGRFLTMLQQDGVEYDVEQFTKPVTIH